MGEQPTAIETHTLGDYELDVASEAGPRIIGFRRKGGTQLFADLPDLMLEHAGIPDYALLGGHRLWRAPEVPEVTYEPDDRAVTVEATVGSVAVEGAPESDGLVKRITVRSRADHVVVDHELRNDSWAPIECAPWAITQMRPGGMAVIPQNLDRADGQGVQPNRSVVLWPYTDPSAPEMTWGRELILVSGSSEPAPLKLGQPNDRGWLAYAASGELFVKWSERFDPMERYLDRGATVQVYRNDRFVELETMGPSRVIAPGTSISHQECWGLFEIGEVGAEALPAVIRELDLPPSPGPA